MILGSTGRGTPFCSYQLLASFFAFSKTHSNLPMNLQVTWQVSFVVEGFSALGAVCCELLRATMDRHVVLEVSELGKLLVALVTLVFWLQMALFVDLLVMSWISTFKLSHKYFNWKLIFVETFFSFQNWFFNNFCYVINLQACLLIPQTVST